MGHHILMGRKTYQSIGRPLPGRTNVVITRQQDFQADGCLIVHSLEEAIELCRGDDEIFVIGGADIYQQTSPVADKIYLTIIHQDFEGDTSLFDLDPSVWQETSREDFEVDEKNKFRYSFLTLEKRGINRIHHTSTGGKT